MINRMKGWTGRKALGLSRRIVLLDGMFRDDMIDIDGLHKKKKKKEKDIALDYRLSERLHCHCQISSWDYSMHGRGFITLSAVNHGCLCAYVGGKVVCLFIQWWHIISKSKRCTGSLSVKHVSFMLPSRKLSRVTLKMNKIGENCYCIR